MSGTDTARSGAHIDPAYQRSPPTALLDQIEQLQSDGLLLLDHLTKRPGRRLTQSDNTVPIVKPDVAGDTEPPPAPGSPEGAPSPAALQAAPTRAAARRNADIDDLSLEPLKLSPAKIAQEKEGLRDLVLLVDALARLADPVTPTTIRNSKNWRLKWLDLIILALLGFCFFLSVAMLWRVDEARNLVIQLRQTQNAANEVYGRLRILTATEHFVITCGGATRSCEETEQTLKNAGAEQGAINSATASSSANNGASPTPAAARDARLNHLSFCLPGVDQAGKDNKKPFLAPSSREAEGLCSTLAQHQIREGILFGRLHAWNCSLSQDMPQSFLLRQLISPISDGPRFDFADCKNASEPESALAQAANCGHMGQPTTAANCVYASARATTEAVGENRDLIQDWRKSEFRTIAILSLLANHLLPSLLAFMGACIYLLRLRFRQRAQSALETLGFAAAFARLLMPAVLGGLLSVVWNGGDVINPATVTIQDLSLSLAFLAFILGYAFDPVLGWLEGKLRETFLKLNGETKEIKVQ
jgi:hypothetical protein